MIGIEERLRTKMNKSTATSESYMQNKTGFGYCYRSNKSLCTDKFKKDNTNFKKLKCIIHILHSIGYFILSLPFNRIYAF
jgi:hypothetical protein